MQLIPYAGPLWSGSLPHEALLELLITTDALIVMRNGAPPYPLVLGVPHQARIGVDRIAADWVNPSGQEGRPSDEGAALYAMAAYEQVSALGLRCKLVIAAHATDHDPNKALGSPYCTEIFAQPSRLLFECHGAGPARRHALELSAGTNALADPKRFGAALARHLAWKYAVVAQLAPGSAEAVSIHADGVQRTTCLSLPALNTTSLAYAADRGVHALHLEARPLFRAQEGAPNALPAAGRRLGQAIAASCREYLSEGCS